MKDLLCLNQKRRESVRKHQILNGLDYLEVETTPGQINLTVYLLGKATDSLDTLDTQNMIVEGGRRIRDIRVVDVQIHRYQFNELDDYLVVALDQAGDFSTYTLRVVKGRDASGNWIPHPDFDPRYDRIDFNFKIDCPSDLDCKREIVCPVEKIRKEPEINYLAKDYASFRQLLLGRLALVMPEWKERHLPDVGITLVEILAYVGDYLSYYQDAVATEAYLSTARQRTSVRRHVRLVDYPMHEGCNARTWLHVQTSQDFELDPSDVFFITKLEGIDSVITEEKLGSMKPDSYEIFEPMTKSAIKLYRGHSKISFYTWGDTECCLPRGAITATLVGKWAGEAPEGPITECAGETKGVAEPPSCTTPLLHLQKGDILIFEEIKGPKTAKEADADPAHRHAVRLTNMRHDSDPLAPNQHLTQVEWAEEDALPFPLCLSVLGPPPADCALVEDLTVARGNIILVDHGRRVEEILDIVPLKDTVEQCESEGVLAETVIVPDRYRPKLTKAPLTFAEPLGQRTPTAKILRQEVRQALPAIKLESIPGVSDGKPLFSWEEFTDLARLATRLTSDSSFATQVLRYKLSEKTITLLKDHEIESSTLSDELQRALREDLEPLLESWTSVRDLLASGERDRHFVVDVDDEGQARLRFGNGELGRLPAAGMSFRAEYRVGGGPRGNVGANTISHLVTRKRTLSLAALPEIGNPFPAVGGTAPEPVAEVKLFAPHAFEKEIQRAITADDYATLVEREFKDKIQRAAATLRWNGSWYEVLVVIDPLGREEADAALLEQIGQRLYRYRRIGHDLVVKSANRVPLDIAMTVCVLPGYLRGHVEAVLINVFSNRLLPDGQLGFFHPDNLSFGEGIYLSKLVAAAKAVPGVENVMVTKFQRLNESPSQEGLENGIVPLGPLEIARLDNDPSFPEYGRFVLDMRGGR